MRRGLSVHPAPNNGRPRRDNRTGGTDDRRLRRCHDGSPAGGDAACANHLTSANDGAGFHRAKGDEASCQQYGESSDVSFSLGRYSVVPAIAVPRRVATWRCVAYAAEATAAPLAINARRS